MLTYLFRHWRGELPLAVAWWVNGVGIAALTVALDLYGGSMGLIWDLQTPRAFTAFLAVGVILLLLVPAWQVIGIFRAADRHVQKVGTILAGRITQSLTTVMTILLAIRFLMFTGESVPGVKMFYSFGNSPYTVSVTHRGRVIEVNGGILFGVTADVHKALDANSRVRRIRLNSGGGSLTEAIKLRELILARALDTDSTKQCSSACVSAYIAGRHRLLHRAARMGFHLPRNPGFGLRSPVSHVYSEELAYLGRHGVPLWFRERWIASGRAFWYPAPMQLRAGGFVQTFVGLPRPGEEIYYR